MPIYFLLNSVPGAPPSSAAAAECIADAVAAHSAAAVADGGVEEEDGPECNSIQNLKFQLTSQLRALYYQQNSIENLFEM